MRRLDILNPFKAPVYHEETVSSTMEVSRLLARDNAGHGTVITADFQEAGRGRIPGRKWETERGQALVFTVLLRFPVSNFPGALPLRAGLAVVLAIEEFAPALAGKALIKWPNDILLPPVRGNSRPALKAAGILAEARDGCAHIGIGVNVSQKRMPDFSRRGATSISLAAGAEYGAEDRFILLEKILSRLRDEIEPAVGAAIGAACGGSDWRERVEARLYKKGEQVCFARGAADSGDLVTGVIAGIGREGELLIILSGEAETRGFTAGELF